MTSSQIFLFGCLTFIGGVGLASFWDFGQNSILAFFILGVFFLSVFQSRKPVAGMGVLILCVAFGLWLHEAAETEMQQAKNGLRNFYGQELALRAKIVEEPELRSGSMHMVIQPEFVSQGRILLISREKRDVQYADVLLVRGKLERPRVFNDFDYEDFLAKDGIYAVMEEPALEVEQTGAYRHIGERAMAATFWLKATFRETLEKYLSSRHSSLMIEMLLGEKGVMSDELAKNLNATGLRHIIAISGMHIAILTMYVMSLFIWLGFWRQQAFYVTLVLVVFYVVLTGLNPSAVRAGVMGGMFLLGQHIGRVNVSLRALVISATGILLFNPFLLTRDVGFQLSFLAVFGMIILLPTILSFLPKKIPARELLAMTLAAQVFTLPILIWNFGQVSLVSIVSNILVVPIVPWLMGLGFFLMVVGTLIPALGFLVSFPVALLVQYILWIVDVFSAFPFAAIQTENLSFLWLVFLYIPIAFFYWKFRKKQEFLGFQR
ncbi:MAG: ComEC/Rec2 family competence protein [Patescibacteria group bacterium]